MGENDKIPPPPSGQIVMPKVIPPPPSGEVVMPVQKKSEVEPTPEEKGVQSTNGSSTVSSQGGEQPQGSGESESLWDIAKRYAGAALEKITSGHGLFGTETEVKNAQKLAEQRKETIQQSVIKNKKEKELIDKSFVRNNVVNEIVKNNNISQENSKDPNIQQLQALYNQLDEVRSGRGVAGADEQTILDRIEEISNKKIEPQQIGVDQFGQPIIKKLPYKNYSDMYDATFKAATKVNDGKAILPELDKQISEGANELRAKKGFKFTGKDANGNDIYEMNPMESFVNGATNTMQSMSIGLHNLTGNKEYALDQMKRKYFEDNVLYPKTTGEGIYGTIAKGTEMLGGVAPLMAAAPMGGIGALAMNTLLFGAQDYGGKLYEKYLEKKSENPDISDEEALKEAEGTAEFAGVKGMILGGTMPLQGALGRKMFLNEAERGAFKSFIAEQGVMIPSFGASTAIQNWYEGKPIEDNVGRSMVDAFIIGGMTHALHALPTMPQKIKTTFENTLAKNYNSLATVFDAGVRDGSIDYATVQRIQERAKGYDVVGKDAPEKAVDKGIELNSIANEIAERKETNPLADVTDLEQKAEEVNKEIHELKGTPLTEKESKELDNLNGKEELTPTEKRKKKHYEKRIETAKQAEEAAKEEETIKRQQEEKTPPIIVPQITVEGEFESPYTQSLKKLGYSDNQISGLNLEQQQQIVDNKIQAPVTDIKEQVVKTDSRKEAARQEKIAEAQRKLDEEVAAEEQEVQTKQEGGGGKVEGGGVLEKTQEVTPTETTTETVAKIPKTDKEIVLFKGQIGKLNADGSRRTAHPNAEGFFATENEETAKRYSGEDNPQKITLPKDVTIEEVEVSDKNKPITEIRREEEKLINQSKAQVVKLKTIDAKGKEVQYIVKDKTLLSEKPIKQKIRSESLENGGMRYFAYDENGDIGSIDVEKVGDKIIIDNAFVEKDYQRKGIAKSLVEQIKKDFKAKDEDIEFGMAVSEEGAAFKEALGKKESVKEPQKAEPTEETAIFAEYNNARSDVARDKAINKLPEDMRKNALDVVKNFDDYLGRFKKLKEEGKIEFETDC